MLRPLAQGFGGPDSEHQLRLDGTRCDRIHGDAEVGEIEGGGSSQPNHARLGRAVRGKVDWPDNAGHGRQVHDPSVAPLGHFPRPDLGAIERPGQIDVKLPLPIVGRDLEEGGAFFDPGVVDQDVQTPQFAAELADRCLDGREVRDVGNGRSRPTAAPSNLFAGRHRLFAVEVDDPDVGPFIRESRRDRLADSLAGSRHDGDLSVKHHAPHLLSKTESYREAVSLGRSVAASLTLILAACASAAPAGTHPQTSTPPPPAPTRISATIREFPLPAGRAPTGITVGPDNNLWFTEESGSRIGRLTLSGDLREIALPIAGAPGVGIIAGPDGNLWFTDRNADQIGRITPAGQITEYPTAENSSPLDITVAPDRTLWFSESNSDRLGRIGLDGQLLNEVTLPRGTAPAGLTFGADGDLWVCASSTNRILRVSPSGQITPYPLKVEDAHPFRITRAPDGNLWFVEFLGNHIGRVTPSGVLSEFPAPVPGPVGITAAADGSLWFTEEKGDAIGRITGSGSITEYVLPPGVSPEGIVIGPDGAPWFSEFKASRIGRLAIP